MRITRKGQVTIPKALRDRYGLIPESEVEFEAGEDGVIIRPAGDSNAQIRASVERATGSATIPITTDQVMKLTRGDI